MLFKLFCIYDCKAEAYLQPFFLRSKGEAIRALQNLVEDPQHTFCKYARDFTLFELGSFDDSSARFDLLATPNSVCVLHELKRLPELNKNLKKLGDIEEEEESESLN